MICTLEEYKKESRPIFDNPTTKENAEWVVADKIISMVKKSNITLDEFIKNNGTYQDFLKKNNLDTVVKHWKPLTEENYVNIIKNIKEISEKKKQSAKEKIKTTNIGDTEINLFEGSDKTYFIDNSGNDKTIEEQIDKIKNTSEDFQTTDSNRNTENMFKELETRKKNLNLNYLYEIDFNSLNSDQKLLYQIAKSYQNDYKGVIRVDLNLGVIVNEKNEILKIENQNGEILITRDDDVKSSGDDRVIEESFQKTLKPSPNTIYSN